MPDQTYAFLDTNFLMHFPPIESIDWCKHLGARSLTLVVDQQVLRELDEMKDGARGQARRDKARSVVAKLHRKLEADDPQQVRENVHIIANLNAVAIDFAQERLDPRVQDDLIIAGMMTFRMDHQDDRITLVASDSGIRLKARARKFETWSPADVLERLDIASEEEKELLTLRRQIAEQQSKKPKFDFGILGKDGIVKHGRVAFRSELGVPWTEERITASVANEKASRLSGVTVSPFVGKSAVERYVEEVDQYIQKYENSLRFESLLGSCYKITLAFGLVNSGAVARHVEAIVEIPDVELISHFDDRRDILRRASRPVPPARPQPFAGSSHYIDPHLLGGLN
ncbi:MAG: hypothetical protein QOF01_4984, partial [Thermomicrobiales bacterium]|nr:hypothetical protein [Thermomicrobiales bacterium]